MLKRYRQALVSLTFCFDLGLTAAALALAFFVRFHSGFFPVPRGIPDSTEYLRALPVCVLLTMLTYSRQKLYVPRRVDKSPRELLEIVRATLVLTFLLAAASFFYRSFEYSRAVLLIFVLLNIALLGASRLIIRFVLRKIRKRGWNLRHALIVGSGKLAQSTAERILKNPWTGLRIAGFLDDRESRQGRSHFGIPVLGGLERLVPIVREGRIDHVYVALPTAEYPKIAPLLDELSHETVDIMIVPDFPRLVSLKPSVGELDGLPIMTVRECPLDSWNRALKRTVDITISLLILFVLSPLFLIVAILVKLGSRGPVFYRQERMGIDGGLFTIYKFRTMRTDAERMTGATWARRDDPRRTPFGRFLRRTSIDELPQFFNVLRGDMSIVGPRPERPIFIQTFKESIPRYMMRHKIKTGITGWAQVNGWRGNTSLKKRIQYDLYYVENWSLWFDFRIMLRTIRTVMSQKNAY